jgi:hypothetical protein
MTETRKAKEFFGLKSLAASALRLFLPILASLLMMAKTARGEDFCAVTLNLHMQDGSPITSTWIELIGPEGKSELRDMVGATTRICDFGFGPHTLHVGTNECLPVTISNVRAVIGSPLRLDVTLNGCGYRETMRNACLLYVRAIDTEGKPVSGATIAVLAANTDSYGRYQGLFKGTRELIVSKGGFESATAVARCEEEEELDLGVVMRKLRPRQ